MFTKEELVEIQQVLTREVDYVKTWAGSAQEYDYVEKLERIEKKALELIAD